MASNRLCGTLYNRLFLVFMYTCVGVNLGNSVCGVIRYRFIPRHEKML